MRDLLTDEDLNDLVQTYVLVDGVHTPIGYTPVITPQALQRAARLGAERERERAARVCEALARLHVSGPLSWQDHHQDMNAAATDCAAAIRRGEGEQAS